MRQKKTNQVCDRLFLSAQVSFVIFILCLSFCNGTTPNETNELFSASKTICHHLLPGLYKLRRGVDITKLDLLPLNFNNDDGYKYPVFDFNCADGKTQYIGESVYNVPDEVSTVTPISKGFLDAQVNIMKKSSDVLKTMSANIGFDTIIKGLFSASTSYKKMTSSFYNESRYVEQVVAYQSVSRATLIPKFALKLGKYAQLYVDKFLPSKFESGPEKYFEFIRTFGTHYFSNMNFGGSLQLYLETMKSYYQGKSDKAVKAESSASFFKILKAMGGISWSVKKVDTKFTASSNQIIRYYGGNTNLLAAGGIAKWQPTVAKNPWVFSGQLVPLSDLIADSSKKESMKKATQIYVDLAYLDSLIELLHWASNKYSSSAQQISNYLQQVKALKDAKAKDHQAVIKLGNKIEEELELPSWFQEQVALCYSWYPDGNGGQCGGGAGRNLCAKVGAMTDYYRDDTDGRGGGCRMSWAIKKYGTITQNWLKQVQICFNWWPDGNGGQCGGGANRNLCAPINHFTPVYRDDTDGRGGGCRMRWKLVVPGSAPIWLKNMKLCFQWYPDGDGGQCGGGVGRLLCATANSWTTAYRDDTDGRGGGCRMRWGLVPS